MNKVDKGILQSINNMMVLEGFTLEEVSKKFKMKKGEIINIFKKEGFTFDREQGFFVKCDENSLIKRIEKLEEQQKVILELLSNTKQKNELKIDNEDILNGKIIGRSFKLYENTSRRFTEFCRQIPELKMYEILSIALERFMEDNK